MKRIIALLAAFFAIAANVRPASACTADAGYRDFPLFTLNADPANLVFGNITVNGHDTVMACNFASNAAGNLETFRNGLNPEFYATLPQNTRLCLHGGNDRVRVRRQSDMLLGEMKCAGFTMRPLAYGGKKLLLVGGAGTDTLSGGDGVDELNLNTDDTDGSNDRAASGRGNDLIRLSSKSTSRAWGGSGTDTYITGGGTLGRRRVEDIDGLQDKYTGHSNSVDVFCDSQLNGSPPNFHPDSTCGALFRDGDKSNMFGATNCFFDIVCETMTGIPVADE